MLRVIRVQVYLLGISKGRKKSGEKVLKIIVKISNLMSIGIIIPKNFEKY